VTTEHVAAMTEWVKPLPAPDGVSAPFWKAAAEGRLLIQRCPACGHRQFYPRALCTACGADPEWMEASGRGTVHTFTIVRQHGQRGFKEELPYVVAIIELEEGPRMMGNVGDLHARRRRDRHPELDRRCPETVSTGAGCGPGHAARRAMITVPTRPRSAVTERSSPSLASAIPGCGR
jgi:uncharacterized OB-fold protein